MAERAKYLMSPDAGILDLLPFPTALVDKNGRFVYRNAAHRQHPLWKEASAVSSPSADNGGISDDEHMRQHRAICTQVVKTGKAQFQTKMVRDPEGALRRYRWLCSPLCDEHGAVEQLLMVELGDTLAPEGLSDRELEVFEHIGHGHTTQEIAEAMLISPKTVESYRARIKEKLGLEHSTELVRRAVQWAEGAGVPPGRPEPMGGATFLDELVREIRSPLASIAGLADSLAQRATAEQAHVADLILRSTQQLIQCLDLKVTRARKANTRSDTHASSSP